MSNILINYASGVAKNEITLTNNAVIDTSNAQIGTGDLSLNSTLSQYAQVSTSFSTYSAVVGNGISFSGWFYPNNVQQVGNTLFHILGDNTSVSLFYDTSSMLVGYFNGAPIQSSYVIQPNTWHFFCYTIYCTIYGKALQTLYIDPINNATIMDNSGTYISFTSTNRNYIGNGIGNIGGIALSPFNGKIDDFRFYNRVLAYPEINVLYNFSKNISGIASSSSSINAIINSSASYSNANVISINGLFSGLIITRNPPFSSFDTCANIMVITCKDLISLDGTYWSFVDTSVNQNTNYSYTITPYIMNIYGNSIVSNNTTTYAFQNGFFNTSNALPSTNNSVINPTLNAWTITSINSTYYLCRGQGAINSVNTYTGTLPGTITYYIAASTPSVSSIVFIQNIRIYQNTPIYVTFYAWTADTSFGMGSSSSTLSVSFGGKQLLNSYVFTTGNAVPYTSFMLPCSFSTSGTFPLVFTINNTTTTPSTICFSGIQIQNQLYGDYTYSLVDPSMLKMYYPLDNHSGTGLLSNYATGLSVIDASLVGSYIQSYGPTPVIGNGYIYTNGTNNNYAQLGSWTCPTNNSNNGFTITGWYYPSVTNEISGATLFSFSNTSGGTISSYLNPGGYLDFSCNGINSVNAYINNISVSSYKWSMITMTCSGRSDGSGNYNFYINNTNIGSTIAKWPNVNSSYTKNYLGGIPYIAPPADISGYTPPILNYFTGYIDDFRVYNRVLTNQELECLKNSNATITTYASAIDLTGANFYYVF
jgi:Concanavalin A-like lectin/glucanases superfamily